MTTTPRRFGAVSTAAAVLLGLIVATATPASAEDAALLSERVYTDSLGYRHVVGEVQNTGAAPASLQVDLLFHDSAGEVIGSDVSVGLVDVVPVGGRSPFDAQIDPPEGFDHYTVTVSATPANEAPNHHFTTRVANVYNDSAGNRHIVGSVRNDNTTAAEDVRVVFTFYGADGRAVGAEAVGAGTGEPLAPGASASFDEAVNPDIPAYTSYSHLAQSRTAASPPAGSGPDPTPAPEPVPVPGDEAPANTLDCNPGMSLSTTSVVIGQSVTVHVAGTPGSTVRLEGYSRPSTAYAPIRSEVQLGPDGRSAPFSVKPATNARIRLQVGGCLTPGTGKVITVTPVLTIAAARVGTRRYTFSGRLLPAVQNTGRAISLYYRPASGPPVRKGIAYAAKDGTYKATLSFAAGKPRTLSFYWATGSNQTNNAAASKVRALLVY